MRIKRLLTLALSVFLFLESTSISKAEELSKPPMGWNSFDTYYDSEDLNEENIKAQADYMTENMKDCGYQYINLDGGWYDNGSGTGKVFDQYGRLIPGIDRFPSADNGEGFKTLADYIHSKGLKFGIYVIRGIPRDAATSSVIIKGTNVTGEELANKDDTCAWTKANYGLDWDNHPDAAEAYYKSLFELWESWGVDMVKIDDINDSVRRQNVGGTNRTLF